MEYTLENTLKAKKSLIETGFKDSDFYPADDMDVECGRILGEPIIKNNDDGKSAFELWSEKLFWDENEDDYVDYMLKNCIKHTIMAVSDLFLENSCRTGQTGTAKVRMTNGFLEWLRQENIGNQESFTLQSLFEIYINSMCWDEIPHDPSIPMDELIQRL